jgi:BMFP domain-containing protein YqiC
MDNSRILDDLSRVAGGAFSVLSSLGKQVQSNLKDQMGDKFASPSANDDVARLQGVVTKLRIEQEDLKSRIAELEAMMGQTGKKKSPAKKAAPAAKAKSKTKPVAKKAAPKAKTKKRA